MYWRLEQLFKMNKRSLHNFIFIMGIISTVVTLLTSFSTDISNLFSGYEVKFLIKLFIGVFILSIIWSFILIFKITFKVTNKTEMTISVGDIFKKKVLLLYPLMNILIPKLVIVLYLKKLYMVNLLLSTSQLMMIH